jgi:hypothetical protein
MIIVGSVFGITMITPQAGEAAEVFDAGDGAATDKPIARIRQFGTVNTLLPLVTIRAIAARPGAKCCSPAGKCVPTSVVNRYLLPADRPDLGSQVDEELTVDIDVG